MYKNRVIVFLFLSFLSCNLIFGSEESKQGKPVTITSDNYEQETEKGVILVEFWAAWCGPCRKLSPVLNEMAREHTNIKIGKINVDSYKPFALKMGVRSLPTMILYREGEEVMRFSGYYPKEDLENIIINALK